MPSEKFFDGAIGAPRTVVELAWSSTDEYDGVYLTTYSQPGSSHGTKVVHSVIRALRRARNAKYGSDE